MKVAQTGEEVIDRLAKNALRYPTRTAIEMGSVEIRYPKLLSMIKRIAANIAHLPEGRVAADPSTGVEHALLLLACLYAGRCYVPLDSRDGKGHLLECVRIAEPSVLVTSNQKLFESGQLGAIQCISFSSLLADNRSLPCFGPISDEPQRPAYVIFTSGSTGSPKGVLVPRTGISILASEQAKHFKLGVSARVAGLSSPAFDASVSEVVTTLWAGATLVMPAPTQHRYGAGLREFLEEKTITHATIVPSILGTISTLPKSLRVLVSAGEPLNPELVRRHQPGRVILNAYGPTEATVCLSIGICSSPADYRNVGKPLHGFRAKICDFVSGDEIKDGGIGELWISGPGLATGYINQPDLTCERFIIDNTQPNLRWYRTGDRALMKKDRSIELYGRVDSQIKVNGVRLERDEIESWLRGIPGTIAAAIDVQISPNSPTRLVAHVVTTSQLEWQQQYSLALSERRSFARPHLVVHWRKLPTLISGKLDRAALSFYQSHSDVLTSRIPEDSKARIIVEALWNNRLGRAGLISDSDTFDGLGGDSLSFLSLLVDLEAYDLNRSCSSSFSETRLFSDHVAILHACLGKSIGDTSSLVRRFLISGVTGTVGRAIAIDLLKQPDTEIWCIARSHPERAAAARVAQSVSGSCHLDKSIADRIRIIPLDDRTTDGAVVIKSYLSGNLSFQGVIHCAADITLVAPLDNLRKANVESTAIMYEVAQWLKSPIYFMSTLAVGDPQLGRLPEAPLSPLIKKSPSLPYVRTKREAEYLLTEGDPKVPVVVCRLPLIIPRSVSLKERVHHPFWAFVHTVLQTGLMPSVGGVASLHVATLDWVTRQIMRVIDSKRESNEVEIYNLLPPERLSLRMLEKMLSQLCKNLKVVGDDEWSRSLDLAVRSEEGKRQAWGARIFLQGVKALGGLRVQRRMATPARDSMREEDRIDAKFLAVQMSSECFCLDGEIR